LLGILDRRRGGAFLYTSLLGGMGAAILPALSGARELTDASTPAAQVQAFELEEGNDCRLAAGMSSGKFSSRAITEKYLARIERIDLKVQR